MTDVAGGSAAAGQRPTKIRHIVLWLTVLVYMITYMDRVVISAAMPSIEKEFQFDDITVGWILGAFQLSYALFQIPGGWLGDVFGPRKALSFVVIWWSAFTAATAMTWNTTSMIVCRFLFGMGEAGAFPIATRSLSRWMLPSERGFAQGVTHAGSRLGGAITPLFVVFLIGHYGWRSPFFIFAIIGILWAVFWFWYYRDRPEDHKSVNAAEVDLIHTSLGRKDSGKARKAVPWGQILSHPQTWLLAFMYFFYGCCIGVYLSWFPKYLVDAHNVTLTQMGLYASLPLLAGVGGDILGGWISDLMAKKGNLTMARRLVAVFGFLLAAVMMVLACSTTDPMIAVPFFCGAVFGLELTVGVSWAVALDIGDEFAGSVSAVMNTAGNMGSTVAVTAAGYIVTAYGWNTEFYVLACASTIAAVVFLLIDASKKVYREAPPADAPAL